MAKRTPRRTGGTEERSLFYENRMGRDTGKVRLSVNWMIGLDEVPLFCFSVDADRKLESIRDVSEKPHRGENGCGMAGGRPQSSSCLSINGIRTKHEAVGWKG
jgi:hypothetical protein